MGMRQEERQRLLEVAAAPERVACVWLPGFPALAERARRPALANTPLVLLETVGRQESAIRAASPEVAALLPRPADEMSLAGVQYHCPGAVSLPYDAPYYHRCFAALREALDAITPAVEAQPLERFYLDLTGLRFLNLDDPSAVATAIQRVLPPRYGARIGIGTGRFTAWVAAHHSTPTRTYAVGAEEAELFLREAPTTLLPAQPETLRRMQLMGLRKLLHLQRLSRSAMVAQFGREGAYLHRLACGEDREPLDLATTPPLVREVLTFSAPATVTMFLVALRRLLRRLFARPERGQQGVRQVSLRAALEDGGCWERTVTLRRPLEQPEPAYQELHRRLENALPAGAVTELAVELKACAARLDCQPKLLDVDSEWRGERLRLELEQLHTRRPDAAVFQIEGIELCFRLPEQQYALHSYDS